MKKIPLSKRIILDGLDNESMITLYSIQHIDALTKALDVGYFTGYEEYCSFMFDNEIDVNWKRAYDWLLDRMKENNPNHSGEYPIWAELKSQSTRSPITWTEGPYVQIKFSVPKKRILISDFDSWHTALNNHHLDDDFEGEYNFSQEEIMKSWNGIFDIARSTPHPCYGIPSRLQVTIDRVYMEEISKIKVLRSAKYKNRKYINDLQKQVDRSFERRNRIN